MIDEKIDFQFDSICDAGQKGWKSNHLTKEDIKQIEGFREQIIEIKQDISHRASSIDAQGEQTVANLEQKIQSILKLKQNFLQKKEIGTANSHEHCLYKSFPEDDLG